MFYMKGHGLEHFEQIFSERGLSGTEVYVYKADWDDTKDIIINQEFVTILDQIEGIAPEQVEPPVEQEQPSPEALPDEETANETVPEPPAPGNETPDGETVNETPEEPPQSLNNSNESESP